MVAFHPSERLSEAKQRDLRRGIIYLECFHLHLKKYRNHNDLLKEMFYFWTYSNVWDKTAIRYSITISWSVKTPERKTSSVQNVSRSLARHLSSTYTWKSDSHKQLDQLRMCRASLRWMNEIQVLLESVYVLKPDEAWIPLWLFVQHSQPPLHRSICRRSWAFSVNSLFGGPLIRSEYHPTDTTILQRWWACKWLRNKHSLQFYSRGKMVGRCSTSSFRFEERF